MNQSSDRAVICNLSADCRIIYCFVENVQRFGPIPVLGKFIQKLSFPFLRGLILCTVPYLGSLSHRDLQVSGLCGQ